MLMKVASIRNRFTFTVWHVHVNLFFSKCSDVCMVSIAKAIYVIMYTPVTGLSWSGQVIYIKGNHPKSQLHLVALLGPRAARWLRV
jgi:hypothetical protein